MKGEGDKTLEERRGHLAGGDITEHPDGYRTMIAHTGFSFEKFSVLGGSDIVAYIELPEGHPDIGKHFDDLDPDVNGGLTYGSGRIFGWDYAHAYNDMNVDVHVRNALEYFGGRKKK